MIVYHGTPFGGKRDAVTRFLAGRNALIPFLRPEDLWTALDVCQQVIADCSAYTAWKQQQPIMDWRPYYDWLEEFHQHPTFAWAIIPDVIDGTEEENDELLEEWPSHIEGVPVWHLHESLERLDRLCKWPRFCFGSSGQYSTPGSKGWFRRMRDAMEVVCPDDHGMPRSKPHGLRMACAEYTGRFPFASVDSTNVAQNANSFSRFGTYCAPTRWQRAESIAYRMEALPTIGYFKRSTWYAGTETEHPLFTSEIQRTEGAEEFLKEAQG